MKVNIVIRQLLKKLKINSSPKTPEIDFNPKTGVFSITGISVPEDSVGFYKPILAWLRNYLEKPAKETILEVKLAYVNTSSLQTLYELLTVIDGIDKSQSKVSVKWHYLEEDEDMKDVGEDLREAVGVNFEFKEANGRS